MLVASLATFDEAMECLLGVAGVDPSVTRAIRLDHLAVRLAWIGSPLR